jgi:hypothetical protein
MRKGCYRGYVIVLAGLLGFVGVADAQNGPQYRLMEKLAQKVIEKYQTTSCQELAQQKNQPKAGQQEKMQERVIEMLRNDSQLRAKFLNQVAGPIANKMFECGMIP